jgi:hypothetical protein
VELHGEGGLEAVDGEGVVFAGEVAGEVCRGDVGDCFLVDADGLFFGRRRRRALLSVTLELVVMMMMGSRWGG